MAAPDFVVVGHAVRDVTPDGWRLGGTITFAAAQAHMLGYSAGVVTRASPDVDVATLLPYAEVVQRPSDVTTCFENRYAGGARQQRVRERAAPLAADDLPRDWRGARIALIGPVLAETPPGLCVAFDGSTLCGVSAQGWLRALDDEGNVVRAPWRGEPFWTGADAVFASDEDLPDGLAAAESWAAEARIVAVTEAHQGARIWADGRWHAMPAYPADEVDPTGAGDTFAAAFLIRLLETGDPARSALFGAAAASLSVAGIGTEATAPRERIEARMREHPEVALR